MRQRDRDTELIAVILEDCTTLERRVQRFAATEKSFVTDHSDEGELAYDAIMSPVYRIAEDALHLSEDVREFAPEYPWDDIRGFRNFVAHGYREVDREIAWKVVNNSIPALKKVLSAYLQQFEQDKI